mgnify:CR=1 FL=1
MFFVPDLRLWLWTCSASYMSHYRICQTSDQANNYSAYSSLEYSKVILSWETTNWRSAWKLQLLSPAGFFCRSSSSLIWCNSNNSRSWSWSNSHIFFFFLFFPEMTWDEVCFPQGQGAAARFDLMWLDSVSSCLSVCIAGFVGRSSILHAAAATATWGPSSILHPLRPPQLPPPEEHLLLVRLPGRPHPQV